jgi:hypothetical protein
MPLINCLKKSDIRLIMLEVWVISKKSSLKLSFESIEFNFTENGFKKISFKKLGTSFWLSWQFM